MIYYCITSLLCLKGEVNQARRTLMQNSLVASSAERALVQNFLFTRFKAESWYHCILQAGLSWPSEMQEVAHSAELSRGSLLKLQCSDSKSLEGITSIPPHSWEQKELVSSNSDCRNTVISYGTWARISSAYPTGSLETSFHFHVVKLWQENYFSIILWSIY